MNSGEKPVFGKRKGIEQAPVVPEVHKAPEAPASMRDPEELLDLADKYGDDLEFGDTLRRLADAIARQETSARVADDSELIDSLITKVNAKLLRLGQRSIRRQDYLPVSR